MAPSAPRSETRQIGTNSSAGGSPRACRRRLGDCLAVLQGQWKRTANLGRSLAGVAAHRRQPARSPRSLSISRPRCSASAPAIPSAFKPCAYNRQPNCLEPCAALVFGARFRFQQHSRAWCPHSWASGGAVWAVHPQPVGRSRCLPCSRCGSPAPAEELGRWAQMQLLVIARTAASVRLGGDPSSWNPGFARSLQTLGFADPSRARSPARAG